MRRDLTASIVFVCMVFFGGALSAQDKTPDGKIKIWSTTYALGIGGSGGDGILTLGDGTGYAFSVSEFDVGSVGLSEATAEGEVYGLSSVSDFPGVYSALSGNITLGLGGGGTVLQNPKGVILHIRSTSEGLSLNAGVGGVKITLHQN